MATVDFYCEAPRIRTTLAGVELRRHVLFVDCRYERTRALPSEVLAREAIAPSDYDVVVLRGGVGYRQVVEADDRLAGDGPHDGWFVLESSDSSVQRAPHLHPLGPDSPQVQLSPETLREIELWGLMLGREAVLGGLDEHFELASGSHVEQYVRVRDAFADPLDVARTADWLLPFVEPDSVLLGDRPALLALLQAVALTCKQRFGWDIAFGTLDPYPRAPRDSPKTVEELCREGRRMLVVLAVDSQARHEQELIVLSPTSTTAVCLVDVSEESPKSSNPFRHHAIRRWRQHSRGSCSECDHRPVLWRIDPRTEERLPRVRRTPRKVSVNALRSGARLWKAVAAQGALRLHCSIDYDDGERRATRHRPVDVDLSELLREAWFRKQCRQALRGIELPDCIIVPRHDVTNTLLNVAREVWPGALQDEAIHVIPRSYVDEALASELASAERILILDDALVTGRTVLGILDNAQRVARNRWGSASFYAFVALACPSTPLVADRLTDRLANSGRDPSSRFSYGAFALLPEDNRCAFCDERRWLERLRDGLPSREQRLVNQRIRQLSHAVDHTNLLFGQEKPDDREFPHVGPVGNAVAFAAATSVAQALRAEMAVEGQPSPSYIDLAHMVETYREPAVLAGLVRTFTEAELNHVGSGAELARLLRSAPEALEVRTLAELGWAAVMDKVPAPVLPDLIRALRATNGDDVAQLLAGVIERKAHASGRRPNSRLAS